MKLIVLGTGAAMVEELFNTCFALDNEKDDRTILKVLNDRGSIAVIGCTMCRDR